MFNSSSLIFVDYDDPRPWVLYFKPTVSPEMEVLGELHDNISFYLVIILFGIAWILMSIITNYVRNIISNKYSNRGTLTKYISWLVSHVVIKLNFLLGLILDIRIFILLNQKWVVFITVVSVRGTLIIYNMCDFSDLFVIYINSPNNHEDPNNYVYSDWGRLPWIDGNSFSTEDLNSARQHVDKAYLKYFKLQILDTAYSMHTGQRPIKLGDVSTMRGCSNGDVAIILAHCNGRYVSDINVLTAAGRPTAHFKNL